MYEQKVKPTHLIETIMISPEMAGVMLEQASKSGFRNRNISDRRVRFLAHLIESGQWLDSNDCICIDTDGILLNGYHRLTAIIRTSQSIWVTIKRGMDRKTFRGMDTGKKRSPGDVLIIEGVKNANMVARALRLSITYEQDGISLFKQRLDELMVSNSDIYQAYLDNPEIVDSCIFIKSLRMLVRLMPPGFLSFTHYLLTHRDPNWSMHYGTAVVDNFFQKLNADGMSEPHEPTYHFRKRLLEDKLAVGGKQLTLYLKYLMFVKVWNYFITDTKMSVLRVSKDEHFPDFK